MAVISKGLGGAKKKKKGVGGGVGTSGSETANGKMTSTRQYKDL